MDAKEFVKKHGWNDARVCVLNCASPADRWVMRHGDLVSDNDFDDLKTLVDAYELVQLFKGIDKAKMELEACGLNGFEQVLVKLDVGVGYVSKHRLMEAIQLVESVDENTN